MAKLPKQIFVNLEKDGDETYLVAYQTIDDILSDQADTVFGVYELKEIKKLKVKKELV